MRKSPVLATIFVSLLFFVSSIFAQNSPCSHTGGGNCPCDPGQQCVKVEPQPSKLKQGSQAPGQANNNAEELRLLITQALAFLRMI